MTPLLKETAIPQATHHAFTARFPSMDDRAEIATIIAANDVKPTGKRPLLERRHKRWARRAAR